MEQQHRDLRYPTVNFHRSMFLYDQPTGSASRRNLDYNFRAVRYGELERALDAKQLIAGSAGSSAPAGYYSAGDYTQQRGRGSSSYTLFKPIPTPKTETKIEYQTDPAQAQQISDLQKQLKILQDVPKYEPYDFSKERAGYENRISGLNDRISGIQAGFQSQLADTTAKMSAERVAAEQRLGLSFKSQLQTSQTEAAQRQQQMSDQYRSSLQASQTRPEVEGIRFATRGPASQPRMKGISGTFGRKGGRLMKISALNV